MHKRILSFCSLSQSYNNRSYSRKDILLNLFKTIPYLTLKQDPINNQQVIKSVMLSLIPIKCQFQEQFRIKMQKFSLHFPSRSSDIGKSLSTTST